MSSVGAGPLRGATYLRAVVTTACPLRCSFCHAEGDPPTHGGPNHLSKAVLTALLRAAAAAGVRKFKMLGGEPLVRDDLPGVVAGLREAASHADISVITSGVGRPQLIDELFAAGLSRVNVSVHGFSIDAFGKRGGTVRGHALRNLVITRVLEHARPFKLNYVVTRDVDHADVMAFLDWAAPRPVVVNLLDDLRDEEAGSDELLTFVRQLRGPWAEAWTDEDPDSLDTTRLRWRDGLVVELKTASLGLTAPWRACRLCPVRSRCREGISALRLMHDGALQPCMDRPDIRLPLVPLLADGGEAAVTAAWLDFVEGRLRSRADSGISRCWG